MTDDEVFPRVEALLREINPEFQGELTRSSRFKEDLAMDSLTNVELITATERAFGIEIPYEELDNITTMDELTGFVTRLKAT